jgi:hypothetical protein
MMYHLPPCFTNAQQRCIHHSADGDIVEKLAEVIKGHPTNEGQKSWSSENMVLKG